jgi:UDP-N-acetylglucosamine--N-acetylmuramyl-(pentapeptide) pyrophosphoryl-undecaprenol N-acetylglucosamine transferase
LGSPQVLLVGGRSGGHIYALLAIAETLRARDPRTAILCVGERGRMEEDLVPRAGYDLRTLTMPAGWRGAPRWLGLYRQAKAILAEFAPDIVIGSGGQVCLPLLLAARRARRPMILLEPNAIPGRANRLAARFARPDVIGILLPAARGCFPADLRIEEVGYPLRPELFGQDRGAAMTSLGLDPARRTLLVFGGSQGSGHLNEVLTAMLPGLKADWATGWQVLHLGGWINAKGLAPEVAAELTINYHYLPYLHDMAQALAAADLVVGRAGATSLAELAALGLPALLAPLPGLADNHQWFNAQWFGEAGAAVIVPDPELTPQRLETELAALMSNPSRLAAMAAAARGLGKPDAAARVVALMDELLERRA